MNETEVVYAIVLFVLYFSPSLVANARKHHNTNAITVLNLFLGWTVLGWIAALVWAATSPSPKMAV